jgi:hypothetical protein
MSRITILTRNLKTVDGRKVSLEIGRSSNQDAEWFIDIAGTGLDLSEAVASFFATAAIWAAGHINAARRKNVPPVERDFFRDGDLVLSCFVEDGFVGVEIASKNGTYRFTGDDLQQVFTALARLNGEIGEIRRAKKKQMRPAPSPYDGFGWGP